MSTKPQLTGSNPPAAAKQARSRKAAGTEPNIAGRAGSAGGVVLEKEVAKKSSGTTAATASKVPTAPKVSTAPTVPTAPKVATAPKATPKDAPPKRKPRKLNKEPTTTPTAPAPAPGPKEALPADASELEALKSRVRGLEAKVEELYKSAPASGGAVQKSPRRRGKGRKTSSATTTATLGGLAKQTEKEAQEDEEEADEELDRLESELEVARQDLALWDPAAGQPQSQYQSQTRPRTTRAPTSDDADDVEEVPRGAPATGPDRQVTLSGSYRIPLPASLDPQDVRTIQSGVAAAQNVARSFLEQRRAGQVLRSARAEAGPVPGAASASASTSRATTSTAAAKTPTSRPQDQGDAAQDAGRQSWGEWIGGYSLAISRAVKNIEHEAAMEAQQAGAAAGGARARRKRPAPKTTLSGEQVEGLMS